MNQNKYTLNDIVIEADTTKGLFTDFIEEYQHLWSDEPYYTDESGDYNQYLSYGPLKFEIKDTTGIQNFSAEIDGESVSIDASNGYEFGAWDRNNIFIKGDPSASSQSLEMRAFDGTEWSDWDTFNLSTNAGNTAPEISITNNLP